MNALWINRMSAYKHSPHAVETAKRIIEVKVERQNALLRRYKRLPITLNIHLAQRIEEALLFEARAAKQFWAEFRDLLLSYPKFAGRSPRASDAVNRLLDVGYHHLTNFVKKLLEMQQVNPAIALLHTPRKADSAPLAYDLVELFRSDIVDAETLRFLRLKKKPLLVVDQRTIAHFLHEVNERLERKFYLKDFKRCHTYRYYMEVQILKFISAVNHKRIFEPLHLPARHDGRCRPPVLTENNGVVEYLLGTDL